MRLRFLVLLALLLPLSLSAQNVRDSVTIEVVDVPVFVSRGGHPVQGLTRDDFELLVNGRPQRIEYFDVVGGSRNAGQAPESLRERRLFVLLIDVAFSDPHAIGRAQRAAAELIARAPAGDVFAIATFSSRRGVWFATPFTSDRVALARGLATLTTSKSGDPLAIVLSPAERMALVQPPMGTPDGADSFSRDPVIRRLAGEALRDIWLMQTRRAVEHQLMDFTDLAARLSMLQGQKHVVVLSQGYEMAPAGRRDARLVSFSIDDMTGRARTAPAMSLVSGSVFRHLDDMRKAFQSADVLLHTLDLRGVSTMLDSSSLYVLANETGGKALHNRNDFGNALVSLSDTYAHGYVLGFQPGAVKKGHNQIEVRLKDRTRDVTVRHRQGFSGTREPVDVGEGLYLADVVLNDVPQTGTAAALDLQGGRLEMRVPLAPLAAQLGGSGSAELLVYLFDGAGTPVDFHRYLVDVPANASGEETLQVAVPENAKVAKALLRVDDSLGFSRTD